MALVTRSTSASLDASTGMYAPQITGNLYAGEALDVVAACYIKASDGLVYMSNGTNADEAATFDGFTARACAIGEPVTLFGLGTRFRYGTGLTVGANYYIAATKGRLDTAATTGGVNPIARVLHGGTDIRVTMATEMALAGGISAKAVTAGMVALTNTHVLVGDAGGAAADVAVSGDVTMANTGAVTIGAGKVTLANHVAASEDGTVVKVAADVNIIGAIPVIHRIMATALTGDVTVVLTHKTRILDVWTNAVGAGGAGDTITVKNVATAVTNAIDLNVADKTVVRATTLDNAQVEIAAGTNLVVSGASAVNAVVYILGVRVA